MLKKTFLIILFSTSLIGTANSQPSDSVQIKRLVSLCELWGKIKYFHPYLAYKSINWDSVLIQTIPNINAFQTSDDYRKAMSKMLAALNDPATFVIEKTNDNKPLMLPGESHPYSYINNDGILIVEMTDYTDLSNYTEASNRLAAVKGKLIGSKAIIFDIRRLTQNGASWGWPADTFLSSGLTELLVPSDIPLVGERFRINYGLPTTFFAGTYQGGFINQVSPRSVSTSQGIKVPLLFLVNKDARVPDFVLTLHHAGRAIIIAEGDVMDNLLVKKDKIDLGESVKAFVRAGELIFQDGTVGFTPDVTIGPFEKGNEALDWATQYILNIILGKEKIPIPVKSNLSILPYPSPEKNYSDMKFPSEEYRILSAFRIWNAIEYFYPFKNLMTKNWHTELPYFIRKFKNAATEKDYDLAIAEMVACIQDSHASGIGFNVLRSIYGNNYPPISIQIVKAAPVVFKVAHDSIVKKYGIRIGDEILKVDGEKIQDRMVRLEPYISASTRDNLIRFAASLSLYGAVGSEILLDVRNSDGVRKIRLPRSLTPSTGSNLRKRTTESIQELSDHIGYIDMDRLQENQLDEARRLLEKVQSVILDMRGYPSSAAPFQVASWLSDNLFAHVETPMTLSKGEGFSVMNHHQTSKVENEEIKHHYKIPAVVLINEGTQSAAETFTLEMNQSPNTTIIGSNSSGADGVITIFSVPGGREIAFTGQTYTYQNGQQLQRIGIVPDIYIRPTLEGIRKGKDEVLDKGIEYLKKSQKEMEIIR